MLCSDFILEASHRIRPNQLTTAWLGQEKQEEAKAHSNTVIPLFPVLWVRIMPWKQTIRQRQMQRPQISWPIPKRLPTLHSWLAQILHMILLVALPSHQKAILSSLSRAQRLGCHNTETAGSGNTTKATKKMTLMLVASCPGRKNPLTLLLFLPLNRVLTWKWS